MPDQSGSVYNFHDTPENTIRLPGLAVIHARPYRTPRAARQFAQRINADPEGYLSVIAMFQVPGIQDIRPWFVSIGGQPATVPTSARRGVIG